MEKSKEDLILEQLEENRKQLAAIRATQLLHVKDIEKLKVKTGLWSAVVSAVVAIAAGIVQWR
jgi:hypothetical protein